MIFGIVGLILGIVISIFIIHNKVKVEQKKIDDAIFLELQQLSLKKDNLLESISDLERQAERASDIFYKEKMDLAKSRIAADLEEEEKFYQDAKNNYKKQYLDIIEDYKTSLNNQIYQLNQKSIEIEEVEKILDDIKKKIDCAVEVNKKAELQKNQKDYYRCVISEIDQQEIEKIRSIEPYLRNREPLNKVIWSVYYQKPCTDLLGRVIGLENRTGIYKITNLENGMCYVGQAVDFRKRWIQHIKRGIGAENGGNNKLYDAMMKYGVENFTFEIIEDCAPEQLNEREDYWQNFLHAKDFGYSIK